MKNRRKRKRRRKRNRNRNRKNEEEKRKDEEEKKRKDEEEKKRKDEEEKRRKDEKEKKSHQLIWMKMRRTRTQRWTQRAKEIAAKQKEIDTTQLNLMKTISSKFLLYTYLYVYIRSYLCFKSLFVDQQCRTSQA